MAQEDPTHEDPSRDSTGAPGEEEPPAGPSRERRVMDDDELGEDEPGAGS